MEVSLFEGDLHLTHVISAIKTSTRLSGPVPRCVFGLFKLGEAWQGLSILPSPQNSSNLLQKIFVRLDLFALDLSPSISSELQCSNKCLPTRIHAVSASTSRCTTMATPATKTTVCNIAWCQPVHLTPALHTRYIPLAWTQRKKYHKQQNCTVLTSPAVRTMPCICILWLSAHKVKGQRLTAFPNAQHTFLRSMHASQCTLVSHWTALPRDPSTLRTFYILEAGHC